MNAIILAAGMGTRLRPLTDDKPKCLVEVCGVPMVERQIQYLQEVGVSDITLVSGYKAEKLEYLKEKYGVSIVFNDRYDKCNNIYSLYLVRDRFKDTYVLEGDVFITGNCFDSTICKSTYFSVFKENYKNEWGLITDNNSKLIRVNIGDGKGFIMSGISFWIAKDAKAINAEITRLVETQPHTNLFWDNAVLNLVGLLDIRVRRISGLYEIDTEAELKATENEIRS